MEKLLITVPEKTDSIVVFIPSREAAVQVRRAIPELEAQFGIGEVTLEHGPDPLLDPILDWLARVIPFYTRPPAELNIPLSKREPTDLRIIRLQEMLEGHNLPAMIDERLAA